MHAPVALAPRASGHFHCARGSAAARRRAGGCKRDEQGAAALVPQLVRYEPVSSSERFACACDVIIARVGIEIPARSKALAHPSVVTVLLVQVMCLCLPHVVLFWCRPMAEDRRSCRGRWRADSGDRWLGGACNCSWSGRSCGHDRLRGCVTVFACLCTFVLQCACCGSDELLCKRIASKVSVLLEVPASSDEYSKEESGNCPPLVSIADHNESAAAGAAISGAAATTASVGIVTGGSGAAGAAFYSSKMARRAADVSEFGFVQLSRHAALAQVSDSAGGDNGEVGGGGVGDSATGDARQGRAAGTASSATGGGDAVRISSTQDDDGNNAVATAGARDSASATPTIRDDYVGTGGGANSASPTPGPGGSSASPQRRQRTASTSSRSDASSDKPRGSGGKGGKGGGGWSLWGSGSAKRKESLQQQQPEEPLTAAGVHSQCVLASHGHGVSMRLCYKLNRSTCLEMARLRFPCIKTLLW